MPIAIEDLFPGKMGKVELTRVAIRMRRPALLKMNPTDVLDEKLLEEIKATLDQVRQG